MKIRKNKKGFGLVDALGAVIVIGIASTTVIASLVQSVATSARNKQRLLAQSACEFYVNALRADIDLETIDQFFATNSGISSDGDTKTFALAAGADSWHQEQLKKLVGESNSTWQYYSTTNLSLNNIVYNYENVSITITQTSKPALNLYSVTVEIPFYNTRTEAMTYDFYSTK